MMTVAKKSVLASVTALLLVGCNAGKDQTNIENFDSHFDQVAVKAQDWDPRMGVDVGMRVPPVGTVPKGFKPYAYKNKPLEAGKNVKNPMAGDFSPEIIERGKDRYDIYCAVCHGAKGLGDGSVAEKFLLKPPALNTDKVMDFSDGRIYHIISDGQGVMGSYSRQILDVQDRWAVVNYVRLLQKKTK